MSTVGFMDSFERWTTPSNCYGKWAILDEGVITTDIKARSGSRSLFIPGSSYTQGYVGQNTKAVHGVVPLTGANVCVSSGVYIEKGANSLADTYLGVVIFELNNYEVVDYRGYQKFSAIRLLTTQNGELCVEVETTTSSIISTQVQIAGTGFFPAFDRWYHMALEIAPTTSIISGSDIGLYYNATVYINEAPFTSGIGGSMTWLTDDDDELAARLYPTAVFLGRSLELDRNTFRHFQNIYYDDFYISDTFAGDLEVDVIDPMALYSNGWTASTGTNWAAVQKDTHALTPYVSKDYDSTPADELNEMTDVADIDEVVAIQGVILGSKDHGSTAIINHKYNTVAQSDVYLGTDALIFTDVRNVNPDTSVAYTPDEVDDLKFGQVDAY